MFQDITICDPSVSNSLPNWLFNVLSESTDFIELLYVVRMQGSTEYCHRELTNMIIVRNFEPISDKYNLNSIPVLPPPPKKKKLLRRRRRYIIIIIIIIIITTVASKHKHLFW